jgi:membrane-bound lytic murein transglycosylase D
VHAPAFIVNFAFLIKMTMKNVMTPFAAVLAGIFFAAFLSPEYGDSPAADFKNSVQTFPVPFPSAIDFAGEPAPLQMFDVRERLDRELSVNTYFQSQTLFYLKRAARWFPVIEPILKKNGVPEDFKYAAVAESGLTNAVSSMQAVGFWQFMESTAKQFNLEISSEVDERYHVEKSTEAACRFFLNAKTQFGSWTLSAAAYNMGTAALQDQVERQGEKNFYDLLLNDETFRYLFRILAIKEIMEHPTSYGFHLSKKDLYAPLEYSTAVIDTAVADWAAWSRSQHINYKNLKLLNPWLRQNTLANAGGKKYAVKVLKKGYTGMLE